MNPERDGAALAAGRPNFAQHRRPPLALFILPPAGVFVLLLLSFALEGAYSRFSLEVIVPEEFALEDPIPILARLIARRGEARKELIEEGEIHAALEMGGALVSEVTLKPIGGGLFEGTLRAGGGADMNERAGGGADMNERAGQISLRASGVSLRLPIIIVPEPRALALRALGSRERGASGEHAPPLELAAESGRCVPEFPCGLFLLAQPGARDLRLESERGIVWIDEGARVGHSALLRRGRVQNLQPLVRLSADERTRVMPIPIAPGGVASRLPKRLFEEGELIEIAFESLDGRDPVYTLYRGGALVALGRTEGEPLRLGPLRKGEYRLEMDVDPFADAPSLRSAAHRFDIVTRGGASLSTLNSVEHEFELIKEEALRAEPLAKRGNLSKDAGSERVDIRRLRLITAALIVLIGALQAFFGARRFGRLPRMPAADKDENHEAVPELEGTPLFSPAARFAIAILIAYALVAFIVLSRSYIFL